jgi:N-methylhydantoinase B/oxoprolinase/acetone carboxylase alpha subunit
MRAALAALPDGVWRFADVVDSFGPRPGQQVETHVRVEVRIEGDTITFDLTGCDPQRVGNVNAVRAVTVSAAIYALRCALDPELPANGGALRPVTVLTAPGTIVDALAPAAVGAGNVEVSQRVADLCLGALAQARPGRLGAASQGTMNNVLIGGTDAEGRAWVYYETIAGGQGGRVQGPGMSGVHTAMTNTRNTPIEALERTFPLRVRKLALREGSGGAGTHAGGEGIEREVELLGAATVSLITERRRSAPWGSEGGAPASPGENWLLPGGDEARAVPLPDKVTVEVEAGDVIRLRTPGGGWGPPV